MPIDEWLLGAILGVRHALEPDHLIAVCTLVRPADRMLRRGAALGALWGVGHSVSLLVVTGALGAFHMRLPPAVARLFELAVAAMLVLLGARAVRRGLHANPLFSVPPWSHHARAKRAWLPTAQSAEGGPGSSRTSLSPSERGWHPFAVGLVHGLAGSGALAVITLTALPSTAERLFYTAVFGAGSVLGMTLLAVAASLPLRVPARRSRLIGSLAVAAGVLSIIGGLALIVQLVRGKPDEVSSGTAAAPTVNNRRRG